MVTLEILLAMSRGAKVTLKGCVALFAAMVLAGGTLYAVEPLKVEGTAIVGKVTGHPKALCGVSLAWHHFADQFYNEDVVSRVVNDWGAEVVRASISVALGDDYINNPKRALEALYRVVDAAIKHDSYVIVDWHSHEIKLSAAKEFFATVAKRYGEYDNVIYEIFNEPDYETWEEVKEYSVEVIETIRAIDPDNIIIVGSPHWDQDVDIVADDPIVGFDNLVYSFHFYADTHQQENMRRCDYALSKGLPLIISECGGMNHLGQGRVNYEWWGRWTDWARENNVGWVAWSLSDKDETCSMFRVGTKPTEINDVTNLKEWSLLVISSLQENKRLKNLK